jgi:hypothetical protein
MRKESSLKKGNGGIVKNSDVAAGQNRSWRKDASIKVYFSWAWLSLVMKT